MTIPGSSEDFTTNLPENAAAETASSKLLGPIVRYIIQAFAALAAYVPDADTPTPSTDFAERFKYIIISSSLLEASLSPSSANPAVAKFPPLPLTAPPTSRTRPQTRAHQLSRQSNHSRSNSGNQPNIKYLFSPSFTRPPSSEQLSSYWHTVYASFATPRNTSIAAAILAFVLNGYVLLGVLASLALKTPPSAEAEQQQDVQRSSFESTLDGLNLLIGASNAWGSVVYEAISTLEQEERRIFYGPSTPHSPSSSLRVALSSTLQSTQSHSDNIRQLFAPLTSSSQLAQLSEMYAPPPPQPKASTPSNASHPRPQSSPSAKSNRMSLMSSSVSVDMKRARTMKNADKRMTWSGANGGRAIQRRHSLQGLKVDDIGSRGAWSPNPSSSSSTSQYIPSPSSQARYGSKARSSLADIHDEESDEVLTLDISAEMVSVGVSMMALNGFEDTMEDSSRLGSSMPSTPARKPSPAPREDSYTATPPMIKRRRRGSSVTRSSAVPSPKDVLRRPITADGLQHRTLLKSHSHNHLSVTPPPPGGSPSRLSLVQTTRHPLSLAALHEQLQTAMASKRFTAAHLLALRFGDASRSPSVQEGEEREELELLDGEDESYWEDVRSVMELLTTALEDAAAELGNAVDDSSREKARDMEVSPMVAQFPAQQHNNERNISSPLSLRSPFMDSTTTFAPPSSINGRLSQLSTLSVGFAPLPTPLSRYVAHIDMLGKALDDARLQLQACAALIEQPQMSPLTRSSPGGVSPNWTTQRPPIEATLLAWDGLRKDLGVAVRECERGRGSLIDHVKRQTAAQLPPTEEFLDLADSEDGVPALAHDHSSNDADVDSDDRNHNLLPVHEAIYDSAAVEGLELRSPVIAGTDEAMQRLMMEADPRLALGVEQVFTYDSRQDGESSMALPSREKSKLSRAERISQMKAKREQSQSSSSGSSVDTWGPGGEVVQELQSVISRVHEKRKGIASQRLSILGELVTSPEPSPPIAFAAATDPLLTIGTAAPRARSPLSAGECEMDSAVSPAVGIGVAL
ncbi:hypothetical protein FRB98_003348 [Tulasnella sp. 332]|nr:hypothetical protein FRB98_003348 [Tulasnella sp. 332]